MLLGIINIAVAFVVAGLLAAILLQLRKIALVLQRKPEALSATRFQGSGDIEVLNAQGNVVARFDPEERPGLRQTYFATKGFWLRYSDGRVEEGTQ